MRAIAGPAFAACLLGCAPLRAPDRVSEGGRAALEVPFFPDGADQCGPSALASVLGYWGTPATPGALKGEIYRAGLKGSLTLDLLLAARGRGLSAEMAEGSLALVKRELDAGRPVIAFVDVGYRVYPIGHYLVVTGYDDQRRTVFAHSGKRRDQRISYRRFDSQWEKTKRWTLLIKP